MAKIIDKIMDDIDRASEPGKMSKQEAVEFLEQIMTELEGRVEALKDEMAEG